MSMSLFSRVRPVASIHYNSLTLRRASWLSLLPGRAQDARMPKDEPFYEVKKPGILIKFTWTLLIADAICTLTMCELAWNHFTRPAEPTESVTSDDSAAPKYVLRPTYQRAGMVFMHLAFGGWVAFMIGMKSGMSVKRIWLTPRPRGDLTAATRKTIERPKVANFEGFSGFGLRGDGLDVKHCHLSSTESANDLTLAVSVPGNRQQSLSIVTKGVHINGRSASPEEVRTSLLRIFGRKSNTSSWKSGPILGTQS